MTRGALKMEISWSEVSKDLYVHRIVCSACTKQSAPHRRASSSGASMHRDLGNPEWPCTSIYTEARPLRSPSTPRILCFCICTQNTCSSASGVCRGRCGDRCCTCCSRAGACRWYRHHILHTCSASSQMLLPPQSLQWFFHLC